MNKVFCQKKLSGVVLMGACLSIVLKCKRAQLERWLDSFYIISTFESVYFFLKVNSSIEKLLTHTMNVHFNVPSYDKCVFAVLHVHKDGCASGS